MRGLLVISVLTLTACGGSVPEKPQITELATAAVVRAIYPGIDAPPVANCIVDEASAEEKNGLATTNSENSQMRFDTVRAVLARPGTQDCIAKSNVTFPEIIIEEDEEGLEAEL